MPPAPPGALRALASAFTLDYGPAIRRSVWLAVGPIVVLVGLDSLAIALQFHAGLGEFLDRAAEGYEGTLVPVRLERDPKGRIVAVAEQDGPVEARVTEGSSTIAIVIDTRNHLDRPPRDVDRCFLIQRETVTIVEPHRTRTEDVEVLAILLDLAGMEDLSRESIERLRRERLGVFALLVWLAWTFGKLAVCRPIVLFGFSLLALVVNRSAGRGHGYGTLLRIGFHALIPLSALDLATTLVPWTWPPVPLCCLATDDLLCWGVYAAFVGLATMNTAGPSSPQDVAAPIFDDPS